MLPTLALLATVLAPCAHAPWAALLQRHAARYPAWELADAYKLLHQAALGSEHAIADADASRAWLIRELATFGPGPQEPLVDTLGGFARVHLRPFVAARGDPARLLAAFIATAHTPTDTATLGCALEALRGEVSRGRLAWPRAEVAAWVAAQQRAGYPAVHHSARFATTYAPAYRVVRLDLVAGI